jgi:hypothetical protein
LFRAISFLAYHCLPSLVQHNHNHRVRTTQLLSFVLMASQSVGVTPRVNGALLAAHVNQVVRFVGKVVQAPDGRTGGTMMMMIMMLSYCVACWISGLI